MVNNELTFEELRDAAEKLGYGLVKRERIYRLNRVLYAEGSILLYGIQ